MSFNYPSDIPSDFDPAIHLHSDRTEPDQPLLDPSFSEDLVAAEQQALENQIHKNQAGIVIQHRSWNIGQVFLSEDDHSVHTPTKPGTHLEYQALFPSSPPGRATMATTEPQSLLREQSPNTANKRRKVEDQRSPLKAITNNARRKTGFVDDDSESDNEEAEYVHKIPQAKKVVEETIALPEEIAELDEQSLEKPVDMMVEDQFIPIEAYDEPQQQSVTKDLALALVIANTFSGRKRYIHERRKQKTVSYERIAAQRSVTEEGRATKAYYGIDIHDLMEDIAKENADAQAQKTVQEAAVHQSVEKPVSTPGKKGTGITKMWTEKYRARKFTDLVGDERTHRSVLHWLKAWDPIVFPGNVKKPTKQKKPWEADEEEVRHRKVLLITGPPGLGKTTLAHVCAKQCGYEVQEINASDERSRDIVKGRIRDMVGTENVKGITQVSSDGKNIRKAGKPVCVVVDEVDGVTGGSGAGGEGGFVKALIDLILLDQRNSGSITSGNNAPRKGKKGDRFRLLRPLILVCNDVYHPSLRPLRQSSFAETIHVRKPPLSMVVSRMHSIFEKEGIDCDLDGVRRLCEATWGVGSKKDAFGSGTVEGDIRSVLVVGEWVASRYRSSCVVDPSLRVSKAWIEKNILSEVSYGGGAARSLGRGGAREVVERVFKEGAGFPKTADSAVSKKIERAGTIGVAEAAKQRASHRLREMVDASGEHDKIIMDCFSVYPDNPIQDDNYLTKPNAAYEWLHFHDVLSGHIFSSQEWELAPYMSSSILGFHNLFATSLPGHARANDAKKIQDKDAPDAAPYTGPSAPFQVREGLKANNFGISALQTNLSIPLARMYRSKDSIATELLPFVLRFLAPDVKPVIINTSSGKGQKAAPMASVRRQDEKDRVFRAVECMAATGVRFERHRVEDDKLASGGWVYRMEPSLDGLAAFSTLRGKADGVRYAVRSVLEGEWQRRSGKKSSTPGIVEKKAKKEKDDIEALKVDPNVSTLVVKKDFFGRVVKQTVPGPDDKRERAGPITEANRVWVSFHEGYSNAVRRPITVEELMRGL